MTNLEEQTEIDEAEALNNSFLNSGGKVAATYKFPNGNVATFGYDDKQIPLFQGTYSKELEAKIMEHSDGRTEWNGF